jgi:hypothetical protein
MSYADTPIHELPQPESYVKAIEDYFGTEVIVTDDIYDSKYRGWHIYISEESMDGTIMHYTTQDTSKCTYLSNMTTDVQDLVDDLESDIKSGYKVVVHTWFADELDNGGTAEDICGEVWDYACRVSRFDAEKKAKLNLSNIEVNED